MNPIEDIREKPVIGHEDVVGLNFICPSGRFVFRRHYKNGLRSHVMEVLCREAVSRETSGVRVDGILRFPRAVPVKMLRIFRHKFRRLDEAFQETRRLREVERYLTRRYLARSEEFLVDYQSPAGPDVLLCGLQDFVEGFELNPWLPPGGDMFRRCHGEDAARIFRVFQNRLGDFVVRVKRMAREVALLPDLAGQGNLLVTSEGAVTLVDINNISRVRPGDAIALDDKGYPVCDKSVEALALMETIATGTEPDRSDALYGAFLTPERKERVQVLDRRFHRKLSSNS
ncbi:MAG: hypothetical protein LJE65_06465 [Desulfobacteraceae bacterium]|nr:hypothetical protein [Desulfobacteraceae bacterium]